MTATAIERLPPNYACTRSNIGQVATAIIVAQVDATKNGRTIQKLLRIRAPRASSCRVVRARSSDRLGCMLFAMRKVFSCPFRELDPCRRRPGSHDSPRGRRRDPPLSPPGGIRRAGSVIVNIPEFRLRAIDVDDPEPRLSM